MKKSIGSSHVVDLSHPLRAGMPVWPGTPSMGLIEQQTDGKDWTVNILVTGDHVGTHVDAPHHVFHEGTTIANADLGKLVGPAIVIDLRSKRAREKIEKEDLDKYESEIKITKRVLLNFGWDKYFTKSKSKFYFTEFPELSVRAAYWLSRLGIYLIGSDTPSPSLSDDLKVHQVLLGHGALIVENLRNLDGVSGKIIYFIGAALKIEEAEASPIRALALQPNNITSFMKDGAMVITEEFSAQKSFESK